jgi:hypothetical protein
MAVPAPLQEPPDFSLVLGGPLYQILRGAHLTGPALELLRRRVVTACLFCWLPLAVLSLAQAHLFNGPKLSFFHDIDAQVRFLVALPALIIAELIVHQRLRSIIKTFIDRRIITPDELPKFYAAIESIMRIRNSVVVEVALFVLVFTAGIWVWWHGVALGVPSWYAWPQAGHMNLTLAGHWFAFVSVPLFQFMLLRWYVRILIWFWFLFRVSRLNLHLLPAHPDRAGGLGFLGKSTFAFTPLLFAQALVYAGPGNRKTNRSFGVWHLCFDIRVGFRPEVAAQQDR